MKVLLEFKNSHHYLKEYVKTSHYCPNCGKQEVWEEEGPGDFYEGVSYVCSACAFNFTMPSQGVSNQEAYINIVKQLRENATYKPTTPKGR